MLSFALSLMDYRVLLVEDEDFRVRHFRAICDALSGSLSIDLKVVGEGNPALRAIESFRPHVVFMDTHFPQGPGYGVWEEVPSHIRESTAVVGLCSEAQYVFGFQQVGADDFIDKTYLSAPLVHRTLEYLSSRYQWD